MGIPGGCVADQKLLLFFDPLCHFDRPFCIQHLLEAHAAVACHRREARRFEHEVNIVFGDRLFRNVGQHLGCGILVTGDVEQRRRFVDKLGIAFAVPEGFIVQDI